MVTQRITVAKTAGEPGRLVLSLFEQWSRCRTSNDINEWSAEQWPEEARAEMRDWSTRIRSNGHRLPIIFFTEYVDLWSYCPPDRYLSDHGLVQNCYDVGREMFCLKLPLPSLLAAELEKLSQSGQHNEDRFFARMVLDASSAWQELVDGGVLIFLREVFDYAKGDDEIMDSLKIVPDWLAI